MFTELGIAVFYEYKILFYSTNFILLIPNSCKKYSTV